MTARIIKYLLQSEKIHLIQQLQKTGQIYSATPMIWCYILQKIKSMVFIMEDNLVNGRIDDLLKVDIPLSK